jgi:molybdopterin/thiamine biosynthesis adenylyltransferase
MSDIETIEWKLRSRPRLQKRQTILKTHGNQTVKQKIDQAKVRLAGQVNTLVPRFFLFAAAEQGRER